MYNRSDLNDSNDSKRLQEKDLEDLLLAFNTLEHPGESPKTRIFVFCAIERIKPTSFDCEDKFKSQNFEASSIRKRFPSIGNFNFIIL